jgi:tetratricopeptide (TPR) repeat protein
MVTSEAEGMSMDRAKVAKQAENYLATDRPGKAIEEFLKLLEDSPDDLNLANRLGDILLQEKRSEEAMEMFRRSALGFEQDGFANKAIAIYRKAFRYCPHDRDLAYRLLALYERLHMLRDALRVRVQLADALAGVGKTKDALEEYAKIVEQEPGSAKSRIRLAELCQKESQNEMAAEHFVMAAGMLAAEKMQGEVDRLLDKAKLLDATPKVFVAISRICAAQGDFEGGKRHLEHGLEANPKDLDLLEAKAEMEMRLNKPMAALESLVAGQRLTERALPIIERALRVCLMVGTAAHGVETIEIRVKELARRGFAEETKAAIAGALGDQAIPEYWLLMADLSKIGGDRAARIDALKYALSLYHHDDGHYLSVQGELLGLGVAPSDAVSPGPPDISLLLRPKGAAAGTTEADAEKVDIPLEDAERRPSGGIPAGAKAAESADPGMGDADDGLRQALCSVDFQMGYGSPCDAKAEIERALAVYPDSDDLKARLFDVEGKLGRRAADRVIGAPLGISGILDVQAPQAVDETNDDTGAFEKVRSAEDIYEAFKDRVAQQVGQDDYDTSYNLGIGYKEMGLPGPAIEEFKKAMRDPRRRIECCSMIAMCEEARGDLAAAMEWLRKGIDDRDFPPPDSAGMQRELALLAERARLGQ